MRGMRTFHTPLPYEASLQAKIKPKLQRCRVRDQPAAHYPRFIGFAPPVTELHPCPAAIHDPICMTASALNLRPQAETTTRLPVSVVIITCNAARDLPACLDSVAWAAEVVIVDSGSTDGTALVAQNHGARWIEQVWLGFGQQKQFAVASAGHDWVLCLDADERVSDALRQSLQACFAEGEPRGAAYEFARCNRFLGRDLRHGEGYPDFGVRLFDRRVARWSDDAVHEKVLVPTSPGRLAGDLMHDSAETLSRYLDKQNRYSSLAAEIAVASGRRVGVRQLLFSPLWRFIRFYLLRQGFRDGLPGLIHIGIGCIGSFLKYAKMIELSARLRHDPAARAANGTDTR